MERKGSEGKGMSEEYTLEDAVMDLAKAVQKMADIQEARWEKEMELYDMQKTLLQRTIDKGVGGCG
jgi:Fe-S cluster assembly ATPase SufC